MQRFKITLGVACGVAAMAVALAAAPAAQYGQQHMPMKHMDMKKDMKADSPGVDTKMLAAKLVKSAAVKEGDVVLITGGVSDWALLEDLVVTVRRHGAFPLLTAQSETLIRRLVDEVPARYDGQAPKAALHLAELADVTINLAFVEQADLMEGVPKARLQARAQAFKPVTKRMHERGVRSVSLGNGMLPTADRAQQFDVPLDDLESMYWSAINVDYDRLRMRAQRVANALTAGRTLRITNPNGTDLTVMLGDRKAIASDGVIGPDDLMWGGGALSVYLPAGEAFIAPVPGTARGTVVADHHFYQGHHIRNLRMTFEDGRLRTMTAENDLGPLQAAYDAAPEGKDRFGAVDIGLNPAVEVPEDSRLRTWVADGMVTVGIGNNVWAGGQNDTTFGLYTFLTDCTVLVDGRPLIEEGEIK